MNVNKVKELLDLDQFIDEDIDLKKYIGIQTKDRAIATILDIIIDDTDGVNKVNSILSEIYLKTTIVSIYTNIEIDNYIDRDEDGNYTYDFTDYDILEENRIFEYIFKAIGSDVDEFIRLYNLRLNDILNENNIENIVNEKLERLYVPIDEILTKLINKLDLIDKKTINKAISSAAQSISSIMNKNNK